jgi:hypothetical protein
MQHVKSDGKNKPADRSVRRRPLRLGDVDSRRYPAPTAHCPGWLEPLPPNRASQGSTQSACQAHRDQRSARQRSLPSTASEKNTSSTPPPGFCARTPTLGKSRELGSRPKSRIDGSHLLKRRDAGIVGDYSPHSFRATALRTTWRNGGTLARKTHKKASKAVSIFCKFFLFKELNFTKRTPLR